MNPAAPGAPRRLSPRWWPHLHSDAPARGPLRWAGLLALVAGLGVAGCASPQLGADGSLPATVPRYSAPPLGQPSARLLLRGSVPPGERYALFRLEDAQQCQRPQLVTEGGGPLPSPLPVLVAADTLTTLDFIVLRPGNAGCAVRWSFTPKAGRSYLVQGVALPAGCSARAVDVTAPDRPMPVPDALLRTAANQRCLPLAQSRPMNENSLIQGGQLGGEAVLNPRATAQDLQGLITP